MKKIDLTPTWEQILPAILLVLENGTPEGKRLAKLELLNMAKTADLYNQGGFLAGKQIQHT